MYGEADHENNATHVVTGLFKERLHALPLAMFVNLNRERDRKTRAPAWLYDREEQYLNDSSFMHLIMCADHLRGAP